MPKHTFKTIYWTDDRSSEVNFNASKSLPPTELISACFVFPLYKGDVILSKPKRGWGLPGGHREVGESAEECVRREASEEASIELGELELVGYWEIKKKFHSSFNKKYPDLAYQLLYIADVTALKPFKQEFETSERKVVTISSIHSYHHNFKDFEQVLEYIVDIKGL